MKWTNRLPDIVEMNSEEEYLSAVQVDEAVIEILDQRPDLVRHFRSPSISDYISPWKSLLGYDANGYPLEFTSFPSVDMYGKAEQEEEDKEDDDEDLWDDDTPY